MIPLLLSASSLLNFVFYIYAIGFVIALGLEQYLKFRPLSVDSTMNERNMYIVQTNRKYLWRETWIVNINWFACNVGLYFLSRNMQPVGDNFWQGMLDEHGSDVNCSNECCGCNSRVVFSDDVCYDG